MHRYIVTYRDSEGMIRTKKFFSILPDRHRAIETIGKYAKFKIEHSLDNRVDEIIKIEKE